MVFWGAMPTKGKKVKEEGDSGLNKMRGGG